jgi:hypothetical protein
MPASAEELCDSGVHGMRQRRSPAGDDSVVAFGAELLERHPPCENFVTRHGEAVYISLLRKRGGAQRLVEHGNENLRRSPEPCAENANRATVVCNHAREFRPVVARIRRGSLRHVHGHEHVGGFLAAVRNLLPVQLLHPVGNLRHDGDRLGFWEWRLATALHLRVDELAQVAPVALHHERECVVSEHRPDEDEACRHSERPLDLQRAQRVALLKCLHHDLHLNPTLHLENLRLPALRNLAPELQIVPPLGRQEPAPLPPQALKNLPVRLLAPRLLRLRGAMLLATPPYNFTAGGVNVGGEKVAPQELAEMAFCDA